jgi:hypothetical protein
VAYAEVRQVMASELRQRVRQVVPDQDRGGAAFQSQTGINIETDIDHVVVGVLPASGGATAPSSGLVIAKGIFDEVRIEALMREHGAQVEQYKGKRLIVAKPPVPVPPSDANLPPQVAPQNPPELALSFLKPGVVAIGTSSLIRRAVDLENGGDNVTTNEEVMGFVRSLDASGDLWAVGRFDALRAAARLPVGVAQLPPITWFSAAGRINDGVTGVLKAEASTEEAAKSLRDVVQGFVALASLQAGSRPELKAAVQSLEISGTGKTIALSFSIPGRVVDLIPPPSGRHPDGQSAH